MNAKDRAFEKPSFRSITDGALTLPEVLTRIKAFLAHDPDAEYRLVIGTDSQERFDSGGQKMIHVITAVVVHRRGFGGKYFWQEKHISGVHTLRDKIYAETLTSLDFATQFVPLLKKKLNGSSPKYLLEIHVDVGEHGATREMIKEVTGMVTGNGFIAKTKPYSYGASYIADKHT